MIASHIVTELVILWLKRHNCNSNFNFVSALMKKKTDSLLVLIVFFLLLILIRFYAMPGQAKPMVLFYN